MHPFQHAFEAEMPDIEVAQGRTPQDDGLFAELREVLRKHNALARFGITLLHKHFLVQEDELLVETCDPINRILVCDVRKRAEMGPDAIIEINWRVDAPNVSAVCARVCQSSRESGHVGAHVSANP